jgi:hypothetical protein
MKTIHFKKTIQELIKLEDDIKAGKVKYFYHCPIPLNYFPNQMGINLSAIKQIEWVRRYDGQLESISVHFNPDVDPDFLKIAKHNDAYYGLI